MVFVRWWITFAYCVNALPAFGAALLAGPKGSPGLLLPALRHFTWPPAFPGLRPPAAVIGPR